MTNNIRIKQNSIVHFFTGAALLAICSTVEVSRALAQGGVYCYSPAPGMAEVCHYPEDTPPSGRTPAPLPDVWGAVAASPSMAWGSSWNFRSQGGAEAEALKQCRARATSRADVCKVLVRVADICVSVVTSRQDHILVVGGPIGAANFADGNGILKCRREGGGNCIVEASFCADGIRHVVADPANPAPRMRR